MKRNNNDLWDDMISQNIESSEKKSVSSEIEKKLNDSLKKMQDKIDEKLNNLGGNEDENSDTEEGSNQEGTDKEGTEGSIDSGDNQPDVNENPE